MKKLIGLGCVLALTFGLSFGSFAGSISDADGDGVPDNFDNCVNAANGPLGGVCAAQQDGDLDGYGNTCDSDFDQDGSTQGSDFTIFLAAFGTADPVVDLDCADGVQGSDFTIFLAQFGTAAGPSGLLCAGTIPCQAP